MELKIHTIARDKQLYNATATYIDGKVTVNKGSHINMTLSDGYKPTPLIKSLREHKALVCENGELVEDITFESLSTAASFVTGRTANGMITWKTEDGKYVRHTLSPSGTKE